MKHLAIKLFVLTSIGSTAVILQAEPQISVVPTNDTECLRPSVLQRLFSIEKPTGCSTTAMYNHIAADLDKNYAAANQGDDMYRSSIEKSQTMAQTNGSADLQTIYRQSISKPENVTPENPFSKIQALETVDGYQTLTPTIQ
ncbi:hypothetical protein N9L52_04475 [Litoricolaceae bacterium]|nr:hypothetical protein [Litorivicinaceae bacterium]